MGEAPSAIRIIDDGPVRRIALARPQVRNAFDAALIRELREAFAAPARAVVLTGEGKVFCAGADIEAMRAAASRSEEQNRADAEEMAAMFRAVDECPCPVVALVQGAAMGGGVGLVACSDIVVAADDARFAFSEVRLGIAPAVISPFVLRKIGVSAARRYFLTGEPFGAAEAQRIGLVHEVCPAAELAARGDALVRALAASGPQAVRACKELVRAVSALPRDAALSYASTLIASLRVSPEGQEGLGAFLEKRRPSWNPGNDGDPS